MPGGAVPGGKGGGLGCPWGGGGACRCPEPMPPSDSDLAHGADEARAATSRLGGAGRAKPTRALRGGAGGAPLSSAMKFSYSSSIVAGGASDEGGGGARGGCDGGADFAFPLNDPAFFVGGDGFAGAGVEPDDEPIANGEFGALGYGKKEEGEKGKWIKKQERNKQAGSNPRKKLEHGSMSRQDQNQELIPKVEIKLSPMRQLVAAAA